VSLQRKAPGTRAAKAVSETLPRGKVYLLQTRTHASGHGFCRF
jgi:hypothetical protein